MRTWERIWLLFAAMHGVAMYNITGLAAFISPSAFFIFAAFAFFPFKRFLFGSMNLIDLSVALFVAIGVMSFVLFFLPSNLASPMSFVAGVNVTLLPMVMYLFGKSTPQVDHKRLIDGIISLHFVVVAISIVLHIARPEFYTTAITASIFGNEDAQSWQIYARLQGSLGSTVVGAICAISIFLTMASSYSQKSQWMLSFFFLAGAILSFQRAPILISLFGLGALLIFSRGATVSKLTGAVLAVISVQYFMQLNLDEVERLLARVVEAGQTISLTERETYYQIVPHLDRYPFGMGLGATTSHADAAGYNPGGQMVDANHMRFLADLGPIGLGAFILIVGFSFFKAISLKSKVWLGVVIFVMNLQATVTNVFDSYYVSHLYWLITGIISGAGGARNEKTAHAVFESNNFEHTDRTMRVRRALSEKPIPNRR